MSDHLILPYPLPKQAPILDDDAPRKVLRCGRRFGKSRFGMIAAIAGHGPGTDGNRMFPGILQGGDIVWVAQDYPNLSTVMWREEFKPRLEHLPYISMNANEHFISVTGKGTLYLRPETAIGGIRGIGKNLVGVILDEGAFYDLQGALQDVILPALLDNNGWLIIMSTTNAGPDGNAQKRVPSYFNIICQEIRAGRRGAQWKEFTGTAFDNPKLNDTAIQELIDEYTADSPSLKQEVYAELLVAGIGLALPKLDKDHHLVPRYSVPVHWTQFGGFDWGYNHPWIFGWYAADEDGNIVCIDTLSGREDQAEQIISTIIASGAPIHAPRFAIHSGRDIFTHKGRASGYTGPTIAEKMLTAGLKVIEADTNRVLGLDNFRAYIDWEEDREPRFTMMDTVGNRKALTQLQSIQIDPKNLEDALKVDADIAGRGGDDYYDEKRYALMSRPLRAKRSIEKPMDENRSQGYDYGKRQIRREPSAEQTMQQLFERARNHPTANRFRVPKR